MGLLGAVIRHQCPRQEVMELRATKGKNNSYVFFIGTSPPTSSRSGISVLRNVLTEMAAASSLRARNARAGSGLAAVRSICLALRSETQRVERCEPRILVGYSDKKARGA